MSQSREFANQSNISQQLENEIGNQRGATTTDTFNDAQSFEQQFLILLKEILKNYRLKLQADYLANSVKLKMRSTI